MKTPQVLQKEGPQNLERDFPKVHWKGPQLGHPTASHLQAGQSQFSQPFLVQEVFYPFDHPGGLLNIPPSSFIFPPSSQKTKQTNI